MRRTIRAKLKNSSGVLNRFTGILTRRQINIESLSVEVSEVPDVSQLLLSVNVSSQDEAEQLIKQLQRMIDLFEVSDVTELPVKENECHAGKGCSCCQKDC